MANLYDELQWRSLVFDATDGLPEILAKEQVTAYIGFDPTASSLHIGSLLPMTALSRLQRFGHTPIAIAGGGSDQWGNITAGIELIRKLRGKKAHGLVMPLVTTASGVKFGKTEAGTIWLDPARTPPFRFFQFWLNTDDRDVVAYLKYFTFLDAAPI